MIIPYISRNLHRLSLHQYLMLGVFLFSFSVYLVTVCHYPVNIADSDELITAAYTGGIAHPPGYPLYVGILYIFTHLPGIKNISFAAHVSAALFQSLSLVCFYAITQELCKRLNFKDSRLCIISSLLGTAIIAFSYLFWTQATYAEVFSLNNLFISLIILFIMQRRSPYIISFLFGFAIAHHQTAVMLLPGYLYLLYREQYHQWIKIAFIGIAAFILPYVLLLPFNSHPAALSWEFTPTLAGWWQLISRAMYAPNGHPPPLTVTQNLIRAVQSIYTVFLLMISHLGVISVVMAGIGIYAATRKNKRIFNFFIPALCITGPLLAGYMRLPLEHTLSNQLYYYTMSLSSRMFSMFEFIAALFIPCGIITLIHLKPFVSKKLIRGGFLGFMGVLSLTLLISNYSLVIKSNRPNDQIFYTQVLQSLPPNSVLFIDSDDAFGFINTQAIVQVRPDVLLIPAAMQMRWNYLHQYLSADIFAATGYYKLILTLTHWSLSEHRSLFVFNPRPQFINQMEVFHYLLTPYEYTLQISLVPKSIGPTNYSLTTKLAAETSNKLDYWDRFNKAKFAVLHVVLAHYYNQTGYPDLATQNLQLADQLTRSAALSQSYADNR